MEGLDDKFITVCRNMSPHQTNKRPLGGEISTFDNGCATYTDCYNHFVIKDRKNVKKLVITRGVVGNAGEANLSRLVLRNTDTLEEICYFPDRTKNGLFIRPYYDTPGPDSRTKQCTLPNLKIVRVDALGVVVLMQTYILPQIDTLHICVKEGFVNDDAFKILSDKLLAWYPSLKKINCFVEFGTIYEIQREQ